MAPSLAENLFDSFGEWESQFSRSNPPSSRSPTLQGRPPSRVVGPHTQSSVERENSQLRSGKMRADVGGVGGRSGMIKIHCLTLKELIKY